MWLALAVLFVALCPGVLFRIPPLGKKMGGKFSSIVMHAIVFVIVARLLLVVNEGFQSAMKAAGSSTTLKKAGEDVMKKVADSGETVRKAGEDAIRKVADASVMVEKNVEKALSSK